MAFFRKAVLSGSFLLENALFKGYVDLRDAKIRRLNYKNDSSTAIGARIDLRGAWITEAHFENIVFEKDVDFSDVEFGNLIKEVLFGQNDVRDWGAFLKKLWEQVTSKEDNPGKRIWKYFDDSLKNYINNLKDTTEPGYFLEEKIIDQLNSILGNKDFYDKKYFKGFDEKNQVIRTLLKKIETNLRILKLLC